MYPSMLRTSGDWFADFDQLQDRLDELFGGRAATSSIRAVGRAGAFPALNVGTSSDALEIYALAPGVDPKSVEVSVEKGDRPARRGAQRLRQRALQRALSPCRRATRGRRPEPGRGELSQRRAEDRRAQARSIEAAPDPGDERRLSTRPIQSKETHMATQADNAVQ